MRCGDINNRVALNNTGFEDSEGEMLNFYAQYDFTDNVSLRYTFSDNTVNQLVLRDGDYTSRVASADTHELASDGLVPYLDRQYYMIYDYEETSHELLLNWALSDKTDLIIGAFAYESDLYYKLSRWEYSHDFRFTVPDTAAAAVNGLFTDAPVTDCPSFVQNVLGPVFGLNIDPTQGSIWGCPGDFGEAGRDGGDLRARVPFGTGTINETKAFFANVDHQINESWSVSAGLRWLEDDKFQPPELFTGNSMLAIAGVPVVVGFSAGGLGEPASFDKVVGQFSVEYTTDADNMIYGRISTGHKPGVFNFASPPVPGVPTTVEESTLTNYEAGFKGSYLEGRLQLAASAFYMDYDKMHLNAIQVYQGDFIPNEFDQSPLAEFVSAIPDSKVYGLELEYQYAFSESTSLIGFYAYTDSEIGEHTSVIPGNPDAGYELYQYRDFDTLEQTQAWYELPTNQTGNMLPSQANHKASTSVLHNMSLDNGSRVDLLVTWAYNGAWYPTIGNVDLYKVKAHSRFDASATWTAANEQVSAQFYINNLTDEIALNEFIASGGHGGQVFLGSPTNHREMGVIVRWMPEW